MNIKSIVLAGMLLCSTGHSATIFKSGFETNNEPFGTVRQVSDVLQGTVAAKISTSVHHSGQQSVTPGAGSGKYGKFFSKKFSPSLKSKTLWLQCYIKTTSTKSSRYKSFIILKGTTTGGAKTVKVLSVLFYNNRVVVGRRKSYRFSLTPVWHKIRLKLNFTQQNYDLYIDDNFAQSAIPFAATGADAPVDAISLLQLGGDASTKDLTYFDDLYIGTTPPVKHATIAALMAVKAPGDNKAVVTLHKTDRAPVIDGKKNDLVWQNSSLFSPFVTIQGKRQKMQQTAARMSYDDKNLYLFLECFDVQLNPIMNQLDEIITKAKYHDDGAVFKDDNIEIFLAPNPDKPTEYYHFAISASGAVFDEKMPSPGIKWNGKITRAITFTDKGWMIEMKIPLEQFGIKPPLNNRSFNLNLCRTKPSFGELSCWNPTYGSFHNYNKWGKIYFSNEPRAVTSVKLPLKLHEGSNAFNLKLKNSHNQPVVLETTVSYPDADRVTAAKLLSPDNLKYPGQNEVIVSTANERREHCRNCKISYKLKTIDGKVIYSTPAMVLPLASQSPFVTSFIADSSMIYFTYFHNLYIASNSSLFRMLLIQYDKSLSGMFKECQLVIEMPDYLRIVNPAGIGKKYHPLKVKELRLVRAGKKRRQYILTLPVSLTYTQKKMGIKNRYNKRLSIVFSCNKQTAVNLTDSISYYTQAKIKGKTVREKINRMPLTVLPEIKGKMPKKILLITSFGYYSTLMSSLGPEEIKQCADNLLKAGFNMLSYIDYKSQPMDSSLLAYLRDKGMKLEKGFFSAKKDWIYPIMKGQREYLKKYPQYRAVDGNGITHDDIVAISHLLDPQSGYLPIMKSSLAAAAKNNDSLLWDHESRQLGPKSMGYDPQSLAAFKRQMNLSKTPTVKAVQTTYRQQWIKFQCARNAQLGRLYCKLIKQANPKCLFNVYSGYQSQIAKDRYGVDWKLFAGFIDYAECGYRRPLGAIRATSQALGKTKTIFGELIATSAGNLGYDFDKVRINLFRRLTDATGGILVFYDLQVDGRFWHAMGELSRMVADNEKFFISGEKSSRGIKLISGLKQDDVVVYNLPGDKKLLVIFNETGKSVKGELEILKMPVSNQIKDYYTGKTSKGNQITAIIKPYDVKVFVVK